MTTHFPEAYAPLLLLFQTHLGFYNSECIMAKIKANFAFDMNGNAGSHQTIQVDFGWKIQDFRLPTVNYSLDSLGKIRRNCVSLKTATISAIRCLGIKRQLSLVLPSEAIFGFIEELEN